MTCFWRSRLLFNFALIFPCPRIFLKNFENQFIPQRIFSALSTPKYKDKFSIGSRKRKPKKNSDQGRKPSPPWKHYDVFELDPLEGDDAPDIPDTVRQHVLSDILLGVIQDVLNGPELEPALHPVLGDFHVEITRVKMTPNLRVASIFWKVADELQGSEQSVQMLLNENRDHIRRLLPAYSTLSRFPQMSFIKDRKDEYERTVEHLIQEAKQADSIVKDPSKISEEV